MRFEGFVHVEDWVPQRLVTATGANPLPRDQATAGLQDPLARLDDPPSVTGRAGTPQQLSLAPKHQLTRVPGRAKSDLWLANSVRCGSGGVSEVGRASLRGPRLS